MTVYKVVNGVLQTYNGAVNRTGAQTYYEETVNFGSLKIEHKPTTLETAFILRLMSQRLVIYAQNTPEVAEAVRYLRSMGFLGNLDFQDGTSDADQ